MSNASTSNPESEIAALAKAQQAFFDSGQSLPVKFRQQCLKDLAAEFERRQDDILSALASDLGKPPVEAFTSEYHFLLAEIRLLMKNLNRWSRPRRAGNPFYFWPARSEIRRTPFGRVLVVAPWNYPFQISLSPLAAAVAAGNVVLLKPSELAPASAGLMADIIRSVFDPGHAAVIQGGPEIGRELLLQPFDCWFFTGSEKVGRLYAEAAARNLAPITLELGGKCPCVIDEAVDIDRAVERIVSAKFFNAGQTCMAPDFVLVPDSLRERFVAGIVHELESRYGGAAGRDLARIVNDTHLERLRALIPENALRCGEDRPSDRLLAPTVIPDATWESPAMKEEIFGPVLPVVGYTDLDETLQQLAARPSPLALYAFSRNQPTLEKIARSVKSGSVCFNDAIKQAANLELPFGGTGASGMGRYRGRHGFETFSQTRSVTRRWFCRDPFLVKPPYDGQLDRLRKILR